MSDRFIIKGDVCFVRLLTNGDGSSAGLILHGERQLAQFVGEAMGALERMVKLRKRLHGDQVPAQSRL